MKICLSDLYRKVSAQIRKELRQKEAESRLHLYKYYIPLIVNAISESIKIDAKKLSEAFGKLAEQHVKGEIPHNQALEKEDKITERKIEQEIHEKREEAKIRNRNIIQKNNNNKLKRNILKQGSKKKSEFKSKVVVSKRADGGQQTTLDAKILKRRTSE
jgi:DNA topoisomerase-6 subunit B